MTKKSWKGSSQKARQSTYIPASTYELLPISYREREKERLLQAGVLYRREREGESGDGWLDTIPLGIAARHRA